MNAWQTVLRLVLRVAALLPLRRRVEPVPSAVSRPPVYEGTRFDAFVHDYTAELFFQRLERERAWRALELALVPEVRPRARRIFDETWLRLVALHRM